MWYEKMATKTPTVLWAQRFDTLFVTIEFNPAGEHEIEITKEKLSFNGTTAQGEKYACELEFWAPVKSQEDCKIRKGRLIEILIPKEEGDEWDGLTKGKLKHVKVDWNKWQDEDDEEDFDTGGMQDMGMGGMGGMGDMGGMDFSKLMEGTNQSMPGMEDDEDDEDLSDLDEPAADGALDEPAADGAETAAPKLVEEVEMPSGEAVTGA